MAYKNRHNYNQSLKKCTNQSVN